MAELPPASRRLFAHYQTLDLEEPGSRVFVALRLAEDGDREELRWLVDQLGEAELGRILTRRGPRQLSRRSLEFWRRTLGVSMTPAEAGAEVWSR